MTSKSNPYRTIKDLSEEDVRQMASIARLHITDQEVKEYVEDLNAFLNQYRKIDELPEKGEEAILAKRHGYRPKRGENPLNAFITKCDIKGSADGPLRGMRLAVKDNISIAGIEMTAASRVMEGYVPSIDATVVTRLLEAGAHIVGKTNMDEFAAAGTSETSGFGIIINPAGQDLVPGGSSGGSATAVANGDVDAALGTDGAGSVRIPASFCGVVGIKATYGLVSRYGMIELCPSVDHIGPIARDVETAAKVLAVIAGPDWKDPSSIQAKKEDYTKALVEDVSRIKIGVPKEFFNEKVDEGVKDAVWQAVKKLGSLGASYQEVSIPSMEYALAIWFGICLLELATIFHLDGVPICRGGLYDRTWNEAFAKFRRSMSKEFSFGGVKEIVILGMYLSEEYYNRHYVKAMNARQLLRDDFDKVLEEIDLLATPTVPVLPFKFGETKEVGGTPVIIRNTSPMNLTGLPAITVPCGRIESKPMGLQLIGKRFDESTIIRVAYTYEKSK